MSKQVAVRLPDDLVERIDPLVEAGEEQSRTSFFSSALEREYRRRLAERDAAIYRRLAAQDDPDDIAGFVEWAGQNAPGVEG